MTPCSEGTVVAVAGNCAAPLAIIDKVAMRMDRMGNSLRLRGIEREARPCIRSWEWGLEGRAANSLHSFTSA